MGTQDSLMLTVQCTIELPVEKVWAYWTQPGHIVNWNNASPDWFTPRAENDLRPGGDFSYRMEARDGSMGFDFGGTYDEVREHEFISYTLGDGRRVEVAFRSADGGVEVLEQFMPEGMNPHERQQAGWQAIMNNFKAYAEAQG